MALFARQDAQFAAAVSEIVFCNPFLPERIEFERTALGSDFDQQHADWNLQPGGAGLMRSVEKIGTRVEALARSACEKLKAGASASETQLKQYRDMVNFLLYHRYTRQLQDITRRSLQGSAPARIGFFERYKKEYTELLCLPEVQIPNLPEAHHMFALQFQIHRALNYILKTILGTSAPAVRLRAVVWQSIFTHDMFRYARVMHNRMHDITTLITGPSGTGKELVAQAIGLSRYIPFDEKALRFTDDFAGSFHTLNLSALSPTLIESELFGHKRGAFTGAIADRVGWFEVCPPLGTVFLDELGEVDVSIQVKLLRVLESRTFNRIGETTTRHFAGKVIAATNRDLAAEMAAGRFREDLYYRMCADRVETPSLLDRIADRPEELSELVQFIAYRIAGQEGEADALTDEVVTWIQKHLPNHPWPGNIRELEQCVRNILIRGRYAPMTPPAPEGDDAFFAAYRAGNLTADEVLNEYCARVYAQSGNYREAARKLKLDRRTVKARSEEML